MKRFRLFVWALALLVSFPLLPSQKGETNGWLVSFQEQTGGLLSLLKHPHAEEPKLTGMAIYTDWGVLRPGRYEPVGSQNERSPKIREQVSHGERILFVEGELKDSQGQTCGLSYRVAYKLERGKVGMDITLQADRTFQSIHGFLATMLNFSGATEWLARTRKGWLFGEIVSDKRVFQSSQTPLDVTAPTLGVANSKTGLSLVLTLKKVVPEDSLENVFIHANPNGSGGLFLAWCDSIEVKRMEAGESWQVSVELKFLRLDEIFPNSE